MDFKKALKALKKKTVTRDELKSIFRKNEDADLYPVVMELCKSEFLIPVKSSGENGNRVYPLFMKYRIADTNDNQQIVDEISNLHPALQKKSWLKNHISKYEEHRDALLKLDRYLFQDNDMSVPVSRKERSFEIFGEEKQLDDSDFKGVLKGIELSKSDLAFYDTPEYCFHDYIPDRKNNMIILILENKDIWFNLRKLMFENSVNTLFNTRIDGVLYGEGNKISGKDSLVQYNEFLNCNDVRYLYWGDIDRPGLNIFCSLLRNSSSCNINLFVPAYQTMLEMSLKTTMPDSEDKRNITDDYSNIISLFSDKYKEILVNSLDANKRIPQEIITYKWLKENMV